MDQNQMPVQNMPSGESKKSAGPIIGIVIIILVLVIGALYFWGGKLNKETSRVGIQQDAMVENLNQVSSSDTTEDIAADLEATAIQGLDADLSNIENELTAQ